MTYDALLSLRGWGQAELDQGAPDFLAAARFALFAERLSAELAGAERIASTPFPPGEPDTGFVKQKLAAADAIPALRAVLYPEDTDG